MFVLTNAQHIDARFVSILLASLNDIMCSGITLADISMTSGALMCSGVTLANTAMTPCALVLHLLLLKCHLALWC